MKHGRQHLTLWIRHPPCRIAGRQHHSHLFTTPVVCGGIYQVFYICYFREGSLGAPSPVVSLPDAPSSEPGSPQLQVGFPACLTSAMSIGIFQNELCSMRPQRTMCCLDSSIPPYTKIPPSCSNRVQDTIAYLFFSSVFQEISLFRSIFKNTLLGPHSCWRRSPLGPHLTQNWVPIGSPFWTKLGPRGRWEQCSDHDHHLS